MSYGNKAIADAMALGREDAALGKPRRYDFTSAVEKEAYDLSYEKHEGQLAYLLSIRACDVDVSDLKGVCGL